MSSVGSHITLHTASTNRPRSALLPLEPLHCGIGAAAGPSVMPAADINANVARFHSMERPVRLLLISAAAASPLILPSPLLPSYRGREETAMALLSSGRLLVGAKCILCADHCRFRPVPHRGRDSRSRRGHLAVRGAVSFDLFSKCHSLSGVTRRPHRPPGPWRAANATSTSDGGAYWHFISQGGP